MLHYESKNLPSQEGICFLFNFWWLRFLKGQQVTDWLPGRTTPPSYMRVHSSFVAFACDFLISSDLSLSWWPEAQKSWSALSSHCDISYYSNGDIDAFPLKAVYDAGGRWRQEYIHLVWIVAETMNQNWDDVSVSSCISMTGRLFVLFRMQPHCSFMSHELQTSHTKKGIVLFLSHFN